MSRMIGLSLLFSCAAAVIFPLMVQAGDLKLPAYRKIRLPNGLTVLLMERHEVPLVSFHLLIPAGSTSDPPMKAGLASLTAALLRKGTTGRNADQISAELDFIGGSLGAGSNRDFSVLTAQFLRKDLAVGVRLLAEILLQPSFPEAEVVKMTQQRRDGIRSAKDQAQQVISTYFASFLYGSHPYGRPMGGDEESLASIRRDDIVGFYRGRYLPAAAILAVAGDFDPAGLETLIREGFGAWSGAAQAGRKLPAFEPVRGRRLLLVDKPDSTQTFFQIGNLGISRTDGDRVAVDVVNTLFGERFTSRLNTALRIDSGLTYGAGSRFERNRAPGPFVISSYTANDDIAKALDLTLKVLQDLHEKGVTGEELQSAKNYIKGQFPLDIETASQKARLMAELEFFGLTAGEIDGYYARIDAVTPAAARATIRRHFPRENLVFVLIGKADTIRPLASRYAPDVKTRSIRDPGF